MRRQKGFSLAEVALGVTIVAALSGLVAGAASMAQFKARGADHIGLAKELLAAADQYMQDRSGFDYCKNPDNLQRYLKWSNAATPQYSFAWGRWFGGIGRVGAANNAYPAGFSNTDFPLSAGITRGQILYFYKSNNSDEQFLAWDGTKELKYKFYAVQVYDQNGYPMFTGGR